MKTSLQLSSILLLLLGLSHGGHAGVILDDTWAEGSRKEQNLPTKSAWFCSHSTNLVASAGKLSLISADSSRQYVTYFAPTGSPVKLGNAGDAVTVALTFSPVGVGPEATSRNLRFGLFDSSGGKRLAADATPSGKGIQGYALFLNFGQTFGTPKALEITARTNVAHSDLLGSSGAHVILESAGEPGNHSTAFTNGGVYTLQLSIKRGAGSSVEIRTAITGGGLNITNTATDPGATCTKFDTFAVRSFNSESTAARFDLAEFKVEGSESTARAGQ